MDVLLSSYLCTTVTPLSTAYSTFGLLLYDAYCTCDCLAYHHLYKYNPRCTRSIVVLVHVQVLHYVEKPETFVSNIINAGGYIFSPDIFQHLSQVFTANYENELM